jgi:hypothetical protein
LPAKFSGWNMRSVAVTEFLAGGGCAAKHFRL